MLREFSEAIPIAIQIRKPRVAAIFGEEQMSSITGVALIQL